MSVHRHVFIACITSLSLLFSCEKGLEAAFQELQTPEISLNQVIESRVGLRPYRTSGVRIEPEYLENKLIVHNYGHGGAGITLSWGSVKEALSLMEVELYSNQFLFEDDEVAVIGSGVIGLTTAHLLMDKGYRVHIYASDYPPYTTSDQFGGLFWPSAVTFGPSNFQKKRFKKMLHTSYEKFKTLAESATPAFKGVSTLPLYSFHASPLPHEELVAELFKPTVTDVVYDNGVIRHGVRYDIFCIDAGRYLQDLYKKAEARGAVFSTRTFHQKADLGKIHEDVIFNCSGLGSREIFNDAEVIPIRGQLVDLQPQAGINYATTAYSSDMIHPLYMIPLQDRIILGGTFEVGKSSTDLDPFLSLELITNAQNFFQNP